MSLSYEEVKNLLEHNPAVSCLVIREGHLLAVGELSDKITPISFEGITMEDGLQYSLIEQYGALSRETCQHILDGFAPEYLTVPESNEIDITCYYRKGKYRMVITDTPVTAGLCVIFRKEDGIVH